MDVVSKAYGNNGCVGVRMPTGRTRELGLSYFFWCPNRSLHPPIKRQATAGRNPTAVSTADALISLSSLPPNIRFHFKTVTLVKHQKLATLSSNIPRAKGKMRRITPVNDEGGEKGGRNGKKTRRNESRVTKASRMNSWILEVNIFRQAQ